MCLGQKPLRVFQLVAGLPDILHRDVTRRNEILLFLREIAQALPGVHARIALYSLGELSG